MCGVLYYLAQKTTMTNNTKIITPMTNARALVYSESERWLVPQLRGRPDCLKYFCPNVLRNPVPDRVVAYFAVRAAPCSGS